MIFLLSGHILFNFNYSLFRYTKKKLTTIYTIKIQTNLTVGMKLLLWQSIFIIVIKCSSPSFTNINAQSSIKKSLHGTGVSGMGAFNQMNISSNFINNLILHFRVPIITMYVH